MCGQPERIELQKTIQYVTRACFRVAVLLAVWIENTTFVQADGLNVEKLHPVAEIVVIIFYDTSASSVFFFFVLGLTFDI